MLTGGIPKMVLIGKEEGDDEGEVRIWKGWKAAYKE